MVEHVLEEIGLTQSEVKVYLALLELETSKSGEIIKKSGLHSSVVFNALKSLSNKGLINSILKGKVKEYNAVSPNILLNILDEKRTKIKEILPHLKITEKRGKQEAVIYYGVKGIKAAHFEQIKDAKKGEEYLFLSREDEWYNEEVKRFLLHFNLYT